MYTRPNCKHTLQKDSTLLITYDVRTQRWSACCTCCRQWTGWTLTKEEAKARAEQGWWCK